MLRGSPGVGYEAREGYNQLVFQISYGNYQNKNNVSVEIFLLLD